MALVPTRFPEFDDRSHGFFFGAPSPWGLGAPIALSRYTSLRGSCHGAVCGVYNPAVPVFQSQFSAAPFQSLSFPIPSPYYPKTHSLPPAPWPGFLPPPSAPSVICSQPPATFYPSTAVQYSHYTPPATNPVSFLPFSSVYPFMFNFAGAPWSPPSFAASPASAPSCVPNPPFASFPPFSSYHVPFSPPPPPPDPKPTGTPAPTWSTPAAPSNHSDRSDPAAPSASQRREPPPADPSPAPPFPLFPFTGGGHGWPFASNAPGSSASEAPAPHSAVPPNLTPVSPSFTRTYYTSFIRVLPATGATSTDQFGSMPFARQFGNVSFMD
jgi:hypothetical protein